METLQVKLVKPVAASHPVEGGEVMAVGRVYYRADPASQTLSWEVRFGVPTTSGEQAYTRRLRVGPQPVPLDLGWVAGQCTLLALTNAGPPTPRTTLPSSQERAADEAMVMTVYAEINQVSSQPPPTRRTMHDARSPAPVPATLVPVLLVPPGQSCVFKPCPDVRYTVACSAGECVLDLVALPA